MNVIKELICAFFHQNYEVFSEFNFISVVYFAIFIIILLENSIFLAAFLPGDSLLIFIGILIAKGILNFVITLMLLTVATSLGSWLSYLQGRYLKGNILLSKHWCFFRLPVSYYKRTYQLLCDYGLLALFVCRFIAFVRTLFPTIVGLSGLNSYKFHICNIVSSFLWVFVFMLLGVSLGNISGF